MTIPITFRLADDRDFREQMHLFARLLECERSFHERVQLEAQKGISYARAYENVENELEQTTGRRHYAGYECYRVIKWRIQHPEQYAEIRKKDKNQLTLFK